jgi:hypothetical protein
VRVDGRLQLGLPLGRLGPVDLNGHLISPQNGTEGVLNATRAWTLWFVQRSLTRRLDRSGSTFEAGKFHNV